MGEEFDADRIGRRDVGVVADLTGWGCVDIIDLDIKVEVKVLSFLVVADMREALHVQLDIEIEKVKVVAHLRGGR